MLIISIVCLTLALIGIFARLSLSYSATKTEQSGLNAPREDINTTDAICSLSDRYGKLGVFKGGIIFNGKYAKDTIHFDNIKEIEYLRPVKSRKGHIKFITSFSSEHIFELFNTEENKVKEVIQKIIDTRRSNFPYDKFTEKVVGVTFENEDGAKRQDIIKQLSKFDTVTLFIGEYEGLPSIRVDTEYGTIGYITKTKALELSQKIIDGTIAGAEIESVYGGYGDKSFGVSLFLLYKKNDIIIRII